MKQQTKGYIFIFVGLFMLLGFASSTKDYPFLVDGLTLLLFVALPIGWGISLLQRESVRRKRAVEEQKRFMETARQKEILRYLREHDGKATLAMIASDTSIPAAEAETAMHELIIKGLVLMRTDLQGQLVYELFEPDKQQMSESQQQLDQMLEE